jgi:hypothetical protein
MAAVKGPNAEKYVLAITKKLEASTQEEIMNIIKQARYSPNFSVI